MNFDYTDDQKALKDEARRFLAAVSPLSVARAALDGGSHEALAALWGQIGEQGWLGAAIPVQYGGLGLGYVELCALAEELGRALCPVPFASTVYLFAEAVLLAGSEQQKQALLPRAAAGALVGAMALSEGPGALSADRIEARVVAGMLRGVKLPVTDGGAATRAVVLAMGEGGPALYLADLTAPGVTRDPISTIDPSRGGVRMTFAEVPVEPLGPPGRGLALLEQIEQRAAVLIAFEQLGGADRCLEMARDYALERYAFGKPIGANQAIKHKLADVFVANEVARANAYYGAWALSSNAPELVVAAPAARVAASNAYWLAAKENIQTHGGIGFTWAADPQLFYRRARHLSLVLGGPKVWKARLASALAAQVLREEAEGDRP